ncbi:ABC transporter ATP-binding protein [Nodularia spumigena]|uniref:ABC transporter ATP-binding protein n=1 Tax=Nodularia spumigena TaxID=70799 RepID=UPI002B21E442|nr:ATP-binding cassette domain-containing protein [Nodularia spumigena]MEA5558056.1 ATP-binding cassette domain-containing protein [Nodularia spumigena CH309]
MPVRDQTEPVLHCAHLVRLYESPTGRVQAVRGVDLAIEAGVIVAVVGPSGCGKSSLLRMLSGIDRPTAGSVTLSGVDLTRLSDRRRARARSELLTHVHQRPSDNLFAHLTGRQQLERVLARHRDQSEVDAILGQLGLAHRGDATPDRLSGGEQQRLAFGRAVAAGHRVVIADEPTAHLDTDSATSVLDAMEVLAASGVTIVVATHDQRVLRRVHRTVALRDGAVATITEGTTELSVVDRSGRVQLPPDARRLFADGRVRLTIDPENGSVTLEQP